MNKCTFPKCPVDGDICHDLNRGKFCKILNKKTKFIMRIIDPKNSSNDILCELDDLSYNILIGTAAQLRYVKENPPPDLKDFLEIYQKKISIILKEIVVVT